MTSELVVQVQVVHDDREALDRMIGDLIAEKLIACGQIVGRLAAHFYGGRRTERGRVARFAEDEQKNS